MAELTVGQVVDGRYELEAVIGKGGMGCVYRARHVVTHGKVALKILTDTVDAELQQRFLAEARAAATIGHPAIVAVSDASRTPDGQLYIVMELLAGKPLRDSLRTGLPGDQIRRVGLEMLDALGAAHRQGIVHRDLKPENVFLLAGTGAVKILDFGIAKVLGDATTSTITGHILGTIEYMAPEQLLDAATVDGRTDLWATGIILYELIAGVRPFGGTTREAKYAALALEEPMAIEDVVSVTPDVAAFFRTALTRDPNARYQSAQQMADALRRLSMVPQTSAHSAQTGVGATLGTGAAKWDGVPDLRHTVMGARAHPGSIPPPITGSNLPMLYPNTSGHGMQAAPPATTSSGNKIALAVVGALVAFGIAFGVVMATRGSKSETKAVDAATAQLDASAPVIKDSPVVVTVTPDATDWAVPDAPVNVMAGSCKDHCARVDKCKLMRPSCVEACDRPAVRSCLERATSCEELAACYWRNECPQTDLRFNGSMLCTNARACLNGHMTDSVQGCAMCITNLSPKGALVLGQWRVCEELAHAERQRLNDAKNYDAPNPMLKCDAYSEPCSKQ